MKESVFILTFLLFPFFVIAKEKPFIHFTDDNGLNGNSVRCIKKDNTGVLWIGTDNGLSKYDGTTFTSFKRRDGLPNNLVWAIEEGTQNRLYVGCYNGGLAVIENDSITNTFYFKPNIQNSVRQLLYSIQYDILVIGTDFGLFLLKDTTIYSLPHPIERTKHKAAILDICEYKSDIYFTAHHGLVHSLLKLEINPKNISESKILLTDSIVGERFTINVLNDTLYTNFREEIVANPVSQLSSHEIIAHTKNKFLPWSSCKLNDHEILYGGWGGNYIGDLRIFNTKTKRFSSVPYNLNVVDGVNDLFYDKETDIIWVCSFNGLFAIPKTPFELYDISTVEDIVDVNELNGEIYILSLSGIYAFSENKIKLIYDSRKISTELFRAKNQKYPDKLYIQDNKRISWNPKPLGFNKKNHDLFIVTNQGSIELSPDGLGRFLPFWNTNFIRSNRNGYYFVPNYLNGRYYENVSNLKYTVLENEAGRVADIANVVQADDVCYFASYFRGVSAVKDSILHFLNESNSKIDGFLSDIDVAPNGEVWCTSSSGNLCHIGFNDSLFIRKIWNESNSGITGHSYKWLKFNDSYLFVGTNNGLAVIPVEELKKDSIQHCYIFNVNNGYNYISADNPFSDNEDNIYVFTKDKLVKIDANVTANNFARFYASNATIDNQNVDIEVLNNKKLKASTNQVILKWQLIKYPTAKNVKYQYRINGGDWNNQNIINLESIRTGKYNVDIVATDLESSQKYLKTIRFEIDKPLIQKWWFIAGFILLFLFTTSLVFRIVYTNRNRKRLEKLNLIHQNSELKIRSLQGQMNPHFIFNSLNSVQNFILSSKTKEALIYLGSLGKLIRSNLENISEEFISLYEEIEFLKNYVDIEKLRFKQKLKVEINNHITDMNILITPMLIQPLVENAIKHGIAPKNGIGTITIDLNLNNDLMNVIIEDNGVGRNAKKKNYIENYNGKGLDLIQQRIDLLNKKYNTTKNTLQLIDLEKEGKPSGTRVVLTLQAYQNR